MTGWAHEIVNEMMARSSQQSGDHDANITGHIIEYDPKVGMARILLPTLRAEDEDGNEQPMETGWCKLSTGFSGNGFGLQYHPKGGATSENPELGEEVLVTIQNRDTGLAAVANMIFNDEMIPPGAGEDDEEESQSEDAAEEDPEGKKKLKPLELVCKFENGTFLKFYENGDVQLYVERDLIARTKGNLKATVEEGDLEVTVEEGDATIKAEQGDILVEAEMGDILALADVGDIAIEATTGAVEVYAGLEISLRSDVSVDVDAPTVNVLSPIVNIGVGVWQQLCNMAFLIWFNSHQHPTDTGITGPPIEPADPEIHTTIDLAAS